MWASAPHRVRMRRVFPFVRERPEGVEIDVFVQPRASRSRFVGEHDGRLKVQLAAPPVDGAANEALGRLFAQILGVARRQVTIIRGDSSRRKTVAVAEVSAAQLAAALEKEEW